MNLQAAREFGDRIAVLLANGAMEKAVALLLPTLTERTPFRLLDAVGAQIGSEPREVTPIHAYLDRIAAERMMGGWVVIASALHQLLPSDLPGVFERCCTYVESADAWYATDIFGERVPGPALVEQFEPALGLLASWRENPNRWIRRMTGVAVHYWAKKTRGAGRYRAQVCTLLDLLSPMFTERDRDAIKGVGWGLKTLGRYSPDIVSDWLVAQASRPHRELMVRKATTLLPAESRERVIGKIS